MLLHLQSATSLGANGVHGAVVADTLHVGGAGVVGDIDDGLALSNGTGSFHLTGGHERTGVGLVGLATIRVYRLVNGQDGGVAGGLPRDVLELGESHVLRFVEGNRRRRGVEGTETLREFLDGDFQIGKVHAIQLVAFHVEVLQRALLLAGVGSGVLHGVDGGGEGEDDIVHLRLGRLLCGEDGVERFGGRGRRNGGGNGDGTVDGKEGGDVNVWTKWRRLAHHSLVIQAQLLGLWRLTMRLEMLGRGNTGKSGKSRRLLGAIAAVAILAPPSGSLPLTFLCRIHSLRRRLRGRIDFIRSIAGFRGRRGVSALTHMLL